MNLSVFDAGNRQQILCPNSPQLHPARHLSCLCPRGKWSENWSRSFQLLMFKKKNKNSCSSIEILHTCHRLSSTYTTKRKEDQMKTENNKPFYFFIWNHFSAEATVMSDFLFMPLLIETEETFFWHKVCISITFNENQLHCTSQTFSHSSLSQLIFPTVFNFTDLSPPLLQTSLTHWAQVSL